MDETATVPVLLASLFDQPFTYALPAGGALAPGTLVAAPLGNRLLAGAVWPGGTDRVDPAKLKSIAEVLPLPPLDGKLVTFVNWVADYTLVPRGQILRMVLRGIEHFEPEAAVRAYRATGAVPARMTPAREKVLAAADGGLAWPKAALAKEAQVTGSVIDGLVAAGALEEVELPPPPALTRPDPGHEPPVLSDDQQEVARKLRALPGGGFSVSLLDGVTGSGKTEVYFEAVAEALAQGRSVLILLPEIALTAQFLERFEARFGVRPGEWHSQVSPKKRAKLWRALMEGESGVVVGARSALFLPFRDLGLIVVDEEHDAAYKQEEQAIYHARDMAVVRARIEELPVILSSATPSVESRANCELGRYTRLELPERFGEAKRPDIQAIDLRVHPPDPGRFLSQPAVETLAAAVQRGEQGLLFLNRRGYAPLTLCRRCGFRFDCPNCTAWLVEHRFRGELVCHHCGHRHKVPRHCPSCDAEDSLVACGPGVERIAEEVAERFPGLRYTILSSDMAPGIRILREKLAAIQRGEVDLVIGTQIVAKGHDFPGMTAVVVVDGDIGLAASDPRAAERSFQTLEQVVGRAGRRGGLSHGLIQTYQPDHPVMRAIAAQDREAFYASEIALRREARLAPFGRLAAIIVSGRERGETEAYARALARAAPRVENVGVLGPAEAALAIIRGRSRFRLLVKAPRQFDLPQFLRGWLAGAPAPRGSLRLAVDVDPVSFL
ncbi:MAG: primosomal protein N' [Flavobacteriaceae bacterium]